MGGRCETNRGSLNGTHFFGGGSNLMQMYGKFDGFLSNSADH